jgi:hypothetical protein
MNFLGTISCDQIVLAIIVTIVLREVVTAFLPERSLRAEGQEHPSPARRRP